MSATTGSAGSCPSRNGCKAESDDTAGRPEVDYVAAWQTAAEDPEFRSSQDEIVDRDSYIPAMQTADELGLETALARAQQLYDTALQLGNGEDADGLDVSDLTPQLTPARGSDEDRSMTEARTAAKPAATRSTQKIEW